MAKEEKAASLNPDRFTEGGGLIQGDLVWRNPRFETFDYGGKGPDVPAFAVDLEPDEGDMVTQFWSAGNADDFTPSKDGMKLVPTGGRALSKSSNLYVLMHSLQEAKWPADKFPGEEGVDASVFEGMKAHMIRIPAPERRGLKQQKERKYDPEILVVDSVIEYPWDAGNTKGKPKASDDVADAATEVIMAILSENPKGMQKMKLASEAFRKMKEEKKDQKLINAVVQLIGGKDESFITSGPWSYDKGVVSQA